MKKIVLLLAAICGNIALSFAQDVIVLKNSETIQALVQEIGESEVKYKKIDNSSGPNYTLKKSKIFMILYANGSKDVFSDSAEPVNTNNPEQSNVQNNAQNIDIKEIVELAPLYPGGTNALANYLGQNLQYPKDARKKGIQGQVIVRFLVKPNGSISDVQVLKSLQKNCDLEAVRLVKKMPKWVPGMILGKAVGAHYILPINFKLSDN